MANNFGTGQVIIYVAGNTAYTLPALPAGGRYEDFLPEGEEWYDFNGTKHEDKKFRMFTRYHWAKIDPSDRNNIISILNRKGQKEIKFPAFSRRWPFTVKKIERTNAGGSELYDAITIELEGRDLFNFYPNADNLNYVYDTLNFVIMTH